MPEPDFVIQAGGNESQTIESSPINAVEQESSQESSQENVEKSPPNKGRVIHPSTKLISETVVHKKATLPPSILNRLERQKIKYWHFQFKDPNDLERIKNSIRNNDPSITVEYNDQGKKHPDLTISQNGSPIGKLHFLYCNRPDICDSNLFYIKIHYYDFNSDSLLERIKGIMTNVFNQMESTQGGYRKVKKRLTRKRITKRKMRRTRKN